MLIHYDDFDDYSSNNDLGSVYHEAVGISINTTDPQTGRACLSLAGSGDSLTYMLPSGYSSGRLFVGFGANMTTTGTGTYQNFFSFAFGKSAVLIFQSHKDNQKFRALVEGPDTTYETSGSFPVMDTSQWTYLEFMIDIADAAGTSGRAIMRIGGSVVLATPLGILTDDVGSGVDRIKIESNSFNPILIDNLYIADGTGTRDNDFLVRLGQTGKAIYRLKPTADASVQMTRSSGSTNFSLVDEDTPNDLTDYVYGTTGQRDLYEWENLPAGVPEGSINAVGMSGWIGNVNPSKLARLRFVQKLGTTTTLHPSSHKPGVYLVQAPASDRQLFEHFSSFELNPNGQAWSVADVDSLQAGAQVEYP